MTFLLQRYYYVWPNWLQLRDKNLFSISFCQRSESQRSHSLRSIHHVTFYLTSFSWVATVGSILNQKYVTILFGIFIFASFFRHNFFLLFYGAIQMDPDELSFCASNYDSLISLSYSMTVFSTKSFGLFFILELHFSTLKKYTVCFYLSS